MLRDLRGEADMVLAEVDRIASSFLFDSDYLRVPNWILATMPVSPGMKPLATLNSDTRNDWRVVRKSGLRIEDSHRREDFDAFCNQMYLPFIQQRHGSHSVFRTPGYLRRSFRQGGLFYVCDGNERIAATLYAIEGKVMKMLCFGTVGGSYEPVRRGAMCLCTSTPRNWRWRSVAPRWTTAGRGPCARDGVLQFKRKWEMDFACTRDARVDLLMRWERQGPFIQEFLTHSPVFFREGQELNLVAASSSLEPVKLRGQLWVKGISRMHVIGATPHSDKPLPADVVFSDPIHRNTTRDEPLKAASFCPPQRGAAALQESVKEVA